MDPIPNQRCSCSSSRGAFGSGPSRLVPRLVRLFPHFDTPTCCSHSPDLRRLWHRCSAKLAIQDARGKPLSRWHHLLVHGVGRGEDGRDQLRAHALVGPAHSGRRRAGDGQVKDFPAAPAGLRVDPDRVQVPQLAQGVASQGQGGGGLLVVTCRLLIRLCVGFLEHVVQVAVHGGRAGHRGGRALRRLLGGQEPDVPLAGLEVGLVHQQAVAREPQERLLDVVDLLGGHAADFRPVRVAAVHLVVELRRGQRAGQHQAMCVEVAELNGLSLRLLELEMADVQDPIPANPIHERLGPDARQACSAALRPGARSPSSCRIFFRLRASSEDRAFLPASCRALTAEHTSASSLRPEYLVMRLR
mmetsp:Transcript_13433/g.49967  ORF Transcript_13433/g.49967 Transcript_13433/m.49967 type:complete len:359 (+) Transcript_13433:199-1275(+)